MASSLFFLSCVAHPHFNFEGKKINKEAEQGYKLPTVKKLQLYERSTYKFNFYITTHFLRVQICLMKRGLHQRARLRTYILYFLWIFREGNERSEIINTLVHSPDISHHLCCGL